MGPPVVAELSLEYDRLTHEITNVGDLVDEGEVRAFVQARDKTVD